MAVTLALDAGMVRVVFGEFGSVTAAPVHFWKIWPGGAGLAVIVTIVPAVYWPLPVPLITVRLYVAGGGGGGGGGGGLPPPLPPTVIVTFGVDAPAFKLSNASAKSVYVPGGTFFQVKVYGGAKAEPRTRFGA